MSLDEHLDTSQDSAAEKKCAHSTKSANSTVHAGCIKGAERLTGGGERVTAGC